MIFKSALLVVAFIAGCFTVTEFVKHNEEGKIEITIHQDELNNEMALLSKQTGIRNLDVLESIRSCSKIIEPQYYSKLNSSHKSSALIEKLTKRIDDEMELRRMLTEQRVRIDSNYKAFQQRQNKIEGSL